MFPGDAGRFEDGRRAHDVEVDGLGGHAGDVVHVRHRGEVEDRVAALQRADHLREARDVDGLPLHVGAVRLRADRARAPCGRRPRAYRRRGCR